MKETNKLVIIFALGLLVNLIPVVYCAYYVTTTPIDSLVGLYPSTYMLLSVVAGAIANFCVVCVLRTLFVDEAKLNAEINEIPIASPEDNKR